MDCPKCGLINPPEAVKCDCGYEFSKDYKERSSSKSEIKEESPSPWRLVVLIAVAIFLFFGNFHIITGESIGLRIAKRSSFGFSEIFINVDAITHMPMIAAYSKYPLGVQVLQKKGIIESREEFKKRTDREMKEEFDKAMQDAEKEFDKAMQDLGY